MNLPSNIEDLFTQEYEGFRAAKLKSATETIALENELRKQQRSYKTRITRSKKYGRVFFVLLSD